mmetsp:Transcript_65205/g.169682  ORF Transcript_65205/g.169682 Transcript_65205/m.169682 type:complete len:363 (-) Transcript_65205:34-1122(-)
MIDARYRRYRIRDQRRANHWLRRQTLRLRRRAGHRPDWRQAAWAILQSQGHRVDGCRRVRRRELMARPRGRAADEICPQLHSRVVRRTPGVPLGHGQHREAHGLPTTEPAGEDRHALRRVGLLSVPIRTLRRSVRRVLAEEYHQRPVRPLLHELRAPPQEATDAGGGHVQRALDEAGDPVLAPEVDEEALLLAQEAAHRVRGQVLYVRDGGHPVRAVRRDVHLGEQLRRLPGCVAHHNLHGDRHLLPRQVPQRPQWLGAHREGQLRRQRLDAVARDRLHGAERVRGSRGQQHNLRAQRPECRRLHLRGRDVGPRGHAARGRRWPRWCDVHRQRRDRLDRLDRLDQLRGLRRASCRRDCLLRQ